MKELTIHTTYTVWHEEELSLQESALVKAARAAAAKAYAPYSQFCVGAAVLLEDGQVITGNNQENAAYPSGICAERVVLFYANASFPDQAVCMIAISAMQNGFPVASISPCGGCRQVLAETEKRYHIPITILLCGNREILKINCAADLLPLQFDSLDTKDWDRPGR